MSRLLPLNDTDFWWLRYFCGLFLPAGLTVYGAYSLLSLHSYAIWASNRSFQFVPVHGEQAMLMGVAYSGIALALFANCYAQYHEKLGYAYQWILALGAMLAGTGILGCSYSLLVS